MVVVLLCITAITSAAVGFVHKATESKIEEAKLLKKSNALRVVLPEFDNDPSTDAQTVSINGTDVVVYRAAMNGETIGYAVETSSMGFGGEIKMMVGFDQNGTIRNIQVLEHSETPGLGAKIKDEDNPVLLSFAGSNPADLKMSVKKDGGDIDAITASTISSRAYVRAVDAAYAAYRSVAEGAEVPDSVSGATTVNNTEDAAVKLCGQQSRRPHNVGQHRRRQHRRHISSRAHVRTVDAGCRSVVEGAEIPDSSGATTLNNTEDDSAINTAASDDANI